MDSFGCAVGLLLRTLSAAPPHFSLSVVPVPSPSAPSSLRVGCSERRFGFDACCVRASRGFCRRAGGKVAQEKRATQAESRELSSRRSRADAVQRDEVGRAFRCSSDSHDADTQGRSPSERSREQESIILLHVASICTTIDHEHEDFQHDQACRDIDRSIASACNCACDRQSHVVAAAAVRKLKPARSIASSRSIANCARVQDRYRQIDRALIE